jgi:hypothetical protein
MDSTPEANKEMGKGPIVHDAGSSVDYGTGEVGPEIYIDPAREAACRKKFDTYVVPVSVIFLVLSTLDRNNVSRTIPKHGSNANNAI